MGSSDLFFLVLFILAKISIPTKARANTTATIASNLPSILIYFFKPGRYRLSIDKFTMEKLFKQFFSDLNDRPSEGFN
jgi:hypothetical protein